MKSLTYYQHASIKPNDTGGYVDIEETRIEQFYEYQHLITMVLLIANMTLSEQMR